MPRDALALFANDCHEGSHTTSRMVSTIQSRLLPVKPAPKRHEDFLPVNQWTRKEFRRACVEHTNAQRGETNSSATSARGKGKCGHSRKGSNQDNKTSHFYLENLDGVPVLEEQIMEMSRKAHMLWRTLDSDGMAPPTFGQISMRAWEYYSSTMLADEAHDFLLLCNDSEWKLREWSTRSYPSWHRNRFNKDADKEPKRVSPFFYIPWHTTVIMNMLRLGLRLHPSWQQCKNGGTAHRKQRQQKRWYGHR